MAQWLTSADGVNPVNMWRIAAFHHDGTNDFGGKIPSLALSLSFSYYLSVHQIYYVKFCAMHSETIIHWALCILKLSYYSSVLNNFQMKAAI